MQVVEASGTNKDMTVNEFGDCFLQEHRKKGINGKKIEDTTFSAYSDRYNLVARHIGNTRLRDLTYEDLDRCINEIHEETCDTTARQTRDILTSMIHFAYEDGITDVDVLQNERLTLKEKKGKKEKKIIQKEDLKTFIDYCKNNNDIDLLFMLNTGVRASELTGITWDNINWEKGTVTIEKAYMRVKEYNGTKAIGTKKVFKDLKTKNSYRTLGLGTEMLEMLKQHKIRQQELAKQNNTELKETDWVFTTKNYTGFLNDYLADKMKVVMNKLKIKDYEKLTPHCLRHTFCTLGITNGTDVEKMKEILGHSNIGVTIDWYTHLAKQDVIDASKKATGYIDNLMK